MVLVINNKSGESQSQWSTFYLNYQTLMTLQIFFMSNLLSPSEAVLYYAVFVLISPVFMRCSGPADSTQHIHNHGEPVHPTKQKYHSAAFSVKTRTPTQNCTMQCVIRTV